MPLFTFLQLHTGEGLKQEAVQRWNIQSRRVDKGALLASNTTDLALISDRQTN